MAGAFQLAGFPTVIGTMWQIPDRNSATVAEGVYRGMLVDEGELDVRKAACSLHFAIRKVRNESEYQRGGRKFHDPSCK